MDSAEILIAAVVAAGLAIVAVPVAIGKIREVRGTRSLPCPEAGSYAAVRVDARGAALGAIAGRDRLRVKSCSLWPAFQGCEERCLKGFAATAPAR